MNSECQPRRRQRNSVDKSSSKRQIGFQSSPTVHTSRLPTRAAVHTYISSWRTPRMPDRRRRPACYRRYLPCRRGDICECERLRMGSMSDEDIGGRTRVGADRPGCCLFAFCRPGLAERIPAPFHLGQSSQAPFLTPSLHRNAQATHLHLKLDQCLRVVEEPQTIVVKRRDAWKTIKAGRKLDTWRLDDLAINGPERR